MRFAREKRLLLGWLALVAPLPLPLNEPRPMGVVTWPVVVLWVLVMILFLRRASRDDPNQRWLSPTSLNLLGLAYLPILVVDLLSSAQSLPIRPMMHLALFALAAKLFSLEKERDKWHALLGIFFVFVTSTATSTSLGIVAYLIVFMTMGATVLARFSSLHMESFEERSQSATKLRRPGNWLLPATFLLMIPIFWFLPRFTDPFLFGDGGGNSITGTGFSDEVSLDGIGRIRTSSEVALRLEFEEPTPPRSFINLMRFRGATYDFYTGDGWEQTRETRRLRVQRGAALEIGTEPIEAGDVAARAQIWLEPLDARAVIVPQQTLRIRGNESGFLLVNRAGALSFLTAPNGPVNYQVFLGRSDPQWAVVPDFVPEPTLDSSGISPRIRELANQVAGEGLAQDKAAKIERHLQSEYQYELELLGGGGEGAIERFLFERRSGHCEYFASAMVLMLRSEGIPARFVTGFLGAEASPLGYSIVRQSNAHAWVEAYVGDSWRVFDPTPPAGRPTGASSSFFALGRQAYDWLVFSWDRYVVGFGAGEQRRFWADAVAWFRALFESEELDSSEIAAVGDPDVVGAQTEKPAVGAVALGVRMALLLLVVLVVWLAALWWVRRRRDRLDAAANYVSLREAAKRAGIEPRPSPLDFVQQVKRSVPEAGAPTEQAVVLYLKESFSPVSLSRSEQDECRAKVDEAKLVFKDRERKKAS